MTFKDVVYQVKNDPLNVYYYIQGKLLWFTLGKYIKRWYLRTLTCKDCFEAGQCIVADKNNHKCHCEFNPTALTNKKCSSDKT